MAWGRHLSGDVNDTGITGYELSTYSSRTAADDDSYLTGHSYLPLPKPAAINGSSVSVNNWDSDTLVGASESRGLDQRNEFDVFLQQHGTNIETVSPKKRLTWNSTRCYDVLCSIFLLAMFCFASWLVYQVFQGSGKETTSAHDRNETRVMGTTVNGINYEWKATKIAPMSKYSGSRQHVFGNSFGEQGIRSGELSLPVVTSAVRTPVSSASDISATISSSPSSSTAASVQIPVRLVGSRQLVIPAIDEAAWTKLVVSATLPKTKMATESQRPVGNKNEILNPLFLQRAKGFRFHTHETSFQGPASTRTTSGKKEMSQSASAPTNTHHRRQLEKQDQSTSTLSATESDLKALDWAALPSIMWPFVDWKAGTIVRGPATHATNVAQGPGLTRHRRRSQVAFQEGQTASAAGFVTPVAHRLSINENILETTVPNTIGQQVL